MRSIQKPFSIASRQNSVGLIQDLSISFDAIYPTKIEIERLNNIEAVLRFMWDPRGAV